MNAKTSKRLRKAVRAWMKVEPDLAEEVDEKSLYNVLKAHYKKTGEIKEPTNVSVTVSGPHASDNGSDKRAIGNIVQVGTPEANTADSVSGNGGTKDHYLFGPDGRPLERLS